MHINVNITKSFKSPPMANIANICHNYLDLINKAINFWGMTMATLNISIPSEMRQWIDSQVTSGQFANASDYIRDLIRHNQSEKAAIQMALIEGEMSGESSLTVADIIKQQKQIIADD